MMDRLYALMIVFGFLYVVSRAFRILVFIVTAPKGHLTDAILSGDFEDDDESWSNPFERDRRFKRAQGIFD